MTKKYALTRKNLFTNCEVLIIILPVINKGAKTHGQNFPGDTLRPAP